MIKARLLVGVGTVGALVAAGLALAPVEARPDPASPASARARLANDVDGRLVIRAEGGALRFAGVRSGEVDNPAVRPTTTVAGAADAHLARYGAAFGATQDGTTLDRESVDGSVVRYQQVVDGLPVIGGELAVSLRPDRSLGSILAKLSSARPPAGTPLSEDAAAEIALARAAKVWRTPSDRIELSSAGRWLYDPTVTGTDPGAARSVWRFEVQGAPLQHRLVLVDDQTGGVLLDADLVTYLDRVICDGANVPGAGRPCTSGFARVEGGAPSANEQVNSAYELMGAVSDFYSGTLGLDLTDLLGIEVDGEKKLAATVRYCPDAARCPYDNAGAADEGMLFGDGWATADDVTGHELTHGVIRRYSDLFYWGQSGAINESLADVMGEIVDHQHPSPGDSPSDWRAGEDLYFGAIRDMADPTLGSPGTGSYAYPQPDRMTSALWTDDGPSYGDSGGVHTNSGVGNKAAYLISQGGTFNGRTISGIDAGDPDLTKTAVLYYDVIRSLISGSDYADLADVLEQSCADHAAAGTSGFTSADCASVRAAVLATEMRTEPPSAARPADAPDTCPRGTSKRVLFDSETGDPATKLATADKDTWQRVTGNATSGTDSWFVYDLDPAAYAEPYQSSLRTSHGIGLPVGQPAYLHFQHWYVLDWFTDPNGTWFYDGGTVEVNDVATDSLPWVNGPDRVLALWEGNPHGAVPAFGGDSHGWISSRLDLSSYAGTDVELQFTERSDQNTSMKGWFVDDIRVYTCDPLVSNTTKPTVSGTPKVGKTLTAKPGGWAPADVTLTYAWLRSGKAIKGATKSSYKLVSADKGKKIAVRVTGRRPNVPASSVTSAAIGPVR